MRGAIIVIMAQRLDHSIPSVYGRGRESEIDGQLRDAGSGNQVSVKRSIEYLGRIGCAIGWVCGGASKSSKGAGVFATHEISLAAHGHDGADPVHPLRVNGCGPGPAEVTRGVSRRHRRLLAVRINRRRSRSILPAAGQTLSSIGESGRTARSARLQDLPNVMRVVQDNGLAAMGPTQRGGTVLG